MEIEIRHNTEKKYPDFDVMLSSKPGAEPFLTIKSCRLVDSEKGAFIGWPATKNEKSQKWWRHIWVSDKFNAAVLAKVQAEKPRQKPRLETPDDGDEIPF